MILWIAVHSATGSVCLSSISLCVTRVTCWVTRTKCLITKQTHTSIPVQWKETVPVYFLAWKCFLNVSPEMSNVAQTRICRVLQMPVIQMTPAISCTSIKDDLNKWPQKKALTVLWVNSSKANTVHSSKTFVLFCRWIWEMRQRGAPHGWDF